MFYINGGNLEKYTDCIQEKIPVISLIFPNSKEQTDVFWRLMIPFLFKYKTVSIAVINFILKKEASDASNNVLHNDFSQKMVNSQKY